jgi:hypothetical protein
MIHDVKDVNNPNSITISKRKVGKCIEKPTKRMMLLNSPTKQEGCEFQELTQVIIHEDSVVGTFPYFNSLIFIL